MPRPIRKTTCGLLDKMRGTHCRIRSTRDLGVSAARSLADPIIVLLSPLPVAGISCADKRAPPLVPYFFLADGCNQHAPSGTTDRGIQAYECGVHDGGDVFNARGYRWNCATSPPSSSSPRSCISVDLPIACTYRSR